MEEENVTGYRLGISYTCTALPYKLAVIVCDRVLDFRLEAPQFNPQRGMEFCKSP